MSERGFGMATAQRTLPAITVEQLEGFFDAQMQQVAGAWPPSSSSYPGWDKKTHSPALCVYGGSCSGGVAPAISLLPGAAAAAPTPALRTQPRTLRSNQVRPPSIQ